MSLLTHNSRLLSHLAAATTAAVLALGLYIAGDDFLDRLPLPVQLPSASTTTATDNYLPISGPTGARKTSILDGWRMRCRTAR